MSELSSEEIANLFPENTKYVKGECFLNWTYAKDSVTSRFIVECNDVDSSLIVSANASTNKITLIDDTILDNMSFTIRPMFPNGKLKQYGIGSNRNINGINISIINYDTEETPSLESEETK